MSCAVLQGKERVMPDAVGNSKIIKGVTATPQAQGARQTSSPAKDH